MRTETSASYLGLPISTVHACVLLSAVKSIADDLLFLSYPLSLNWRYMNAESSGWEAVEYYVQAGLQDENREFLHIVSHVRATNYSDPAEEQRPARAIVEDFKEVYDCAVAWENPSVSEPDDAGAYASGETAGAAGRGRHASLHTSASGRCGIDSNAPLSPSAAAASRSMWPVRERRRKEAFMPTYGMVKGEAVSGTFRVEAPTADEAAEAARRSYSADGLVLEPSDHSAPGCTWWGRAARAAPGRTCERFHAGKSD